MKLIIFEGLDGSGKTTLIQKVRKQLEKQGHEVITLQGLGSSSIGQPLRDIFLTNFQLKPLTRYLLSFANMFQIQEEEIKPHLETNKIILIDRWLGSNFAYQVYPHICPHNIDKNYQFFNNCLNKQFIKPHLTVYLKIKPQLGLQRKLNQKNHKLDVIESKSLTYFEIVREGYYRYLTHHQCGMKLILNGTTNIAKNIRTIMKYLGEIQNGNHN